MSDITLSGSVSNEEVSGVGILSCLRPTSVTSTPSEASGVLEGNNLLTAAKKQPNKNYNSFQPSPPLEEIIETNQPTNVELTDSCEELKPLICKSNGVCDENNENERVRNELHYAVKKEISYNKVLQFPIITTNSTYYDHSGAVNSLVEFGNDTKSHSVLLGCGQNSKLNGSNLLTSSTPSLTKNTMILCNDLDSACQVVPLSFSPNLYPDVGSVPLINCQVSVNNTVPPGIFNSCSSNSSVTLLSQTKCPNILPASWPRRRPQSLRVAICYSDPECLQDVDECVPSSSACHHDINLSDMSPRYKEVCPSTCTTSLLTDTQSSIIKAIHVNQDGCVDLSKNIREYSEEEKVGTKDQNLDIVKCAKPDHVNEDEILGGYHDFQLKNPDNLCDFIVKPESSLTSLYVNKEHTCISGNQCHPDVHDNLPKSPSTEKESDSALISVRPKVHPFNVVNSPKKKKSSPKIKHRSPKKYKSASTREALPRQQKSLPIISCKETLRREESKIRSLDDDVWAVDDFLPVTSHSQSQSLPQVLQDIKVSPTKALGEFASVVRAPSCKTQASKPIVTPLSFDEMDSSMITSTFSTDTGYETETTVSVNSACNDECSTIGEKLSRKITSPQSDIQKDSLSDICNSSNRVPSSLATPADTMSELATPQTVADDNTEYYSICSELTNLIHALSDAPLPKNPGDDTPDYLSISSEIVGVPKLAEDSPLSDLEMQQIMPGDVLELGHPALCHEIPEALSDLGSSSLDSPASAEPSTLVETPACQDGGSSEPSPSNDSVLSSNGTPSQELVEIKYVQLSLSIVLAIVLHAMQSISQFMLEIFLASDQEDRWD